MRERLKLGAICFDCDSTLTRIEGIDELARRSAVVTEIAPLTVAAMEGALSLEEVYARRLEMVRPSRDALAWLGERYVEEMVEGARETVRVLHEIGKPVYVVSGGFLQSVTVLAQAVGINSSRVRAVEIYLDDTGAYAGFKLELALGPQRRQSGSLSRAGAEQPGAVAIVGDGITDLAARAGGAYVVGFGGVARRQAMAERADYFVADPPLTHVLKAVLSPAEFEEARFAAAQREREQDLKGD